MRYVTESMIAANAATRPSPVIIPKQIMYSLNATHASHSRPVAAHMVSGTIDSIPAIVAINRRY